MIPDVETMTVAYLRTQLTGVSVSTRIPNPRPATLVRVTLSGGDGVRNVALVDALLTVECWAAGGPAASLLARQAASALETWTGPHMDCSTPRYFPDPATSGDRYLFTASGVFRIA